MQQSAIVLVNFAVLAAVVALGSYYIHQWFVSSGWRTALPWFASGLAFAVIIASIGFAILEILPMRTARQEAVSRVALVGSPSAGYRSNISASTQTQPSELETPRRHDRERLRRDFSESRHAPVEENTSRSLPTKNSTDNDAAAVGKSGVSHEVWTADPTFWGATRCVLAIRLDPEDFSTWTLLNDCAVDVRILVATCASALDECRRRKSESWSYVPNGLFLPAKFKRSVALEEQTVRGLHLRYIACRLGGPIAAATLEDQSGALRHVGVESCAEEVRSLSREGSRSGVQIEELVNEPAPPNPCCDRLE